MSGSSSYKPVGAGKTNNNVIPDASAQVPALDHGSGSVGNDPPTTGSQRRSSNVGLVGSLKNLNVSISSPDAQTDRKEG